jgi:hypothetical protein
MEMSTLQTRPEITVITDDDEFYVDWKDGIAFRSRRIKGANLRKLTGIQGTWDAANVSTPAEPDGAYLLEATTAGASPNFLMTPQNGASIIKMAGSGSVTKESGARSARLTASTSGGNFALSAIVIANATATPADVAASLGGGATGTCTHIAAVLLDNAGVFGPGALKVMAYSDDPENGIANEALTGAGGYAAGDEIYVSLDTATGQIVANVNAGADLTVTQLFDTTSAAALRVYVLGYFSANPPGLTDGTFDFDFSTTDGGRTGFATLVDADPPAGALDGKRYLVSGAGTYGGKTLSVGDVAEFYNSLATVFVTPVVVLDEAGVEAIINPYITANPDAVQAIVDASLATFNAPTREYDVFTEYATLGGANPGEFEVGPLTNGATLWSSDAAGALSALTTYADGYTPVPGDSFYLQFNEFDQVVNIGGGIGTHATAVATGWKFADYTVFAVTDFMRTKGKRYQFVFTYIDGLNDKWTLMNPDSIAWTTPGAGTITAIGDGQRGFPGVTESAALVGNSETYVRLESEVRSSYNVEPFKPGESCRIAVVSNTGRYRIMGNSSGAGGITFTSNLPVQSILVGLIYEPAVDVYGDGHIITMIYQGNDTWHVDVSSPLPGIKEVSGTTYTVTGDDNNAVLWFTNAAGCAVTLPKDATEALPPGFSCTGIAADAAGVVTYAVEAPDVLASKGSLVDSNGQYSEQRIIKKSSGLWWLGGDLA